MTAIRRVLGSISGKFPQIYPNLEKILEKSLYICLSQAGQSSADEGLTCISELVYNQNEISPTMWGFYYHIIDCYVNQKDIIESTSQASVPLINYMAKAHQYFDQSINGKPSPVETIFQFIAKTFNEGAEIGDEITSMCGITLIMALIEHISEKNVLSHHMDTINQFYLQEMDRADT
jgi:hypothetical protein